MDMVDNPHAACVHGSGNYMRGHDEQLPYTDSSMHSMYHTPVVLTLVLCMHRVTT